MPSDDEPAAGLHLYVGMIPQATLGFVHEFGDHTADLTSSDRPHPRQVRHQQEGAVEQLTGLALRSPIHAAENIGQAVEDLALLGLVGGIRAGDPPRKRGQLKLRHGRVAGETGYVPSDRHKARPSLSGPPALDAGLPRGAIGGDSGPMSPSLPLARHRPCASLSPPMAPRPAPTTPRRPSLAAALLLGLLTGACSRASDPTWISLSRGFHPTPAVEVAGHWAAGPADRILPAEDPADAWIERTLTPEDWRAGDEPGVFEAARPRDGAFRHRSDGQTRLVFGEEVLTRRHAEGPPQPGEYTVDADRIRVAPVDGGAPGPSRFAVRITSGRERNGKWHMRGNGSLGAAIPVWSGSSETITTAIPEGSQLLFVTNWSAGTEDGASPPRFRVLLDDEPIFDAEDDSLQGFRRIDLPPGGADAARLTFEVSGPPGLGLFLDPELAPVEHGSYRGRPWGEQRPDLILFLADTFRADNLAVYGGEQGLTPNLDRFASESVRFLAARSTSSWTLPSIASILTGLHPGQHGATDKDLALPDSIETLAESLAASGYRTGAITDGGFFSQGFGLDQGFSWFRETSFPGWNVRTTLADAAAFLDRDDGRPVFLLVHTYRVHAPYRVGPQEDHSTWNELMKRGYRALAERGNTRHAREATLLSLADPMRELYHEGVRDLDAAFGDFRSDLERRGLFDRAHILFTSDHGEAFGEHGDMEHGKDLWDVKVRVPLLLHGPGIEPADITSSVSLLDITATLAPLAGVADPGHGGTSLLAADGDRASYSWLLESTRKELALALGTRKVFCLPTAEALSRGEVERAFRLDEDPGEENDLVGEPWASELLRSEAEHGVDYLTPRAEAHSLGAAARERADLRQIGYGGE
ncbi:MAG TPA: hypothetical protein ENJ09_01925 [Planctomycetes bacterium]|nr:hypothetical protein [Planctomycetota bacterium]